MVERHEQKLPVDMPAIYDTTLADKAYDLADRWNNSTEPAQAKIDFNKDDLKDFSSGQIGQRQVPAR